MVEHSYPAGQFVHEVDLARLYVPAKHELGEELVEAHDDPAGHSVQDTDPPVE